MKSTRRPFVIVESPFAGDVKKNVAYARAALADCIRRGETPFASHLLYTQLGVLDDGDPEQRKLGIEMGYEFWRMADAVVFYTDLGFSRGMEAAALQCAKTKTMPRTERTLQGWCALWDAAKGNLDVVARYGQAGALFNVPEGTNNFTLSGAHVDGSLGLIVGNTIATPEEGAAGGLTIRGFDE